MAATLDWIQRGARAAFQTGLDAAADLRGRALPLDPASLAQVEIVSYLLASGPNVSGEPLPNPVRVSLAGVDFESSNCQNFLIDVEFEDGAMWGEGSPLPSTLYAKIPCDEWVTRVFANAVGFWESELAFCRRLAHRVPIRVPRVFAAEQRGARFVLLLENLNEIPGAKLFINRDMAAGTTPARAEMCIDTFAELHAEFWGIHASEREALLPNRLHTYLSPGGSERSRALNAAAISGAHRAAPEIFTVNHVRIAELGIEKWDSLMRFWYSEPLTLIHGDSHLANFFEYESELEPRMGMLDFQGIQWCKGVRDLQYFLINSIEPSVLAEVEEDLIATYVNRLRERGVEFDLEDARLQYRAFSFQTLMVAVVSIGLGSLTEREETVRTVLRRSVAAIERLELGDWLAML